jgi:hypothetical protein
VLWHTVLREEVTIMPDGDTGAWHVAVPGDDPESTTNKVSSTEAAALSGCGGISGKPAECAPSSFA